MDLAAVVPPHWSDEGWQQRLVREHVSGYRLVETPIVRSGDYHLHFYPRFGSVLDQEQPQLVHIDEEPYNLATFLALRAAIGRGAQALFFTWQNLNRRYPPPFRWFERYAHKRAAAAIAGSEGAASVLEAKGCRCPIRVIPQFGVDPREYTPPRSGSATRVRAPTEQGPFRVGYVGRLVPAKGVDLLVEALAGLETPWALEIVGDGPARPGLERQVERLSAAERVRFRSWLDGSLLPDFYSGLDALVLPSRSTPRWVEQFGRVLIEAMACGVACVGAASGEIPNVLGEAGLTFPENDAAALRDRLELLAGKPDERARLSAAGRRRVLERFTMQHIASATVRLYREVLEGRTAA